MSFDTMAMQNTPAQAPTDDEISDEWLKEILTPDPDAVRTNCGFPRPADNVADAALEAANLFSGMFDGGGLPRWEDIGKDRVLEDYDASGGWFDVGTGFDQIMY